MDMAEKPSPTPSGYPLLGGYSPYGPQTPISPPQSYFDVPPYDPHPTEPSAEPRRSVSRTVVKPIKRFIYRFWLVELTASCISIAVLGALLVVLKLFDRRYVDDTGFYSTVPTGIVNSLTTILRTAMLLPVATALAQLQWSWFESKRPLTDMEVYDDATRGVAGSFLFLMKMTKRRSWNFAAVGALLTVASIAMETIVGGAIYIRVKDAPMTDPFYAVSVPRTNRYIWYTEQTTGTVLGDQIPTTAMIASIERGLSEGTSYGNLDQANLALTTPGCYSGYCDFGSYQSLAVDVQCQDLSAHVTQDESYYYLPTNAALDTALYLDATTNLGEITSAISFKYPDPSIFLAVDDIGPLIANIFVFAKKWINVPPVAVECALYWAVYTYNGTMTGNNWNETVIGAMTNKTTEAKEAAIEGRNLYLEPDDCYINRTLRANHLQVEDLVDHRPECVHLVGARAHRSLQNWFLSPVYGVPGRLNGTTTANGTIWSRSNPFIRYVDSLLDLANSTNAADAISRYIFGNLADSMTTTVRYLPRGASSEANGAYVVWSFGVQFDSWRFHVHWSWIAFPGLLVFACAFFSFYVAFTSREHLWKKSNLPLLFHGLGPRERDDLGEVEDYLDMKERAGDMKVRFARPAGGRLRLVEVGRSELSMGR